MRDSQCISWIETHKAPAESASGEAVQTLGINVNWSHLVLLKSIFKHMARNVRQDLQLSSLRRRPSPPRPCSVSNGSCCLSVIGEGAYGGVSK